MLGVCVERAGLCGLVQRGDNVHVWLCCCVNVIVKMVSTVRLKHCWVPSVSLVRRHHVPVGRAVGAGGDDEPERNEQVPESVACVVLVRARSAEQRPQELAGVCPR